MIDFKRLTAVILAVLMLCSVAVIGVSAEDDETPFEAGWYVVGDENFFGVSWGDDIPQEKFKMTLDKGVYSVTVTDAPVGTFTFKVVEASSIGAVTMWHPDGMGNDSSFTVTEAGSTVRFCLVPQKSNSNDKPYAEVFAPGAEIPELTEPTTASKPTTPPETVPEGKVKVNVKSNIGATVSEIYDTSLDQTVTVSFKLNCSNLFANIQGLLNYDSSVLELTNFEMNSCFENPVINTKLNNKVTFNSTNDDNIYDFYGNSTDFDASGNLAMAEFKIIATGETDVELVIEEINGITQSYDTYAIVSDGVVADSSITVNGSADMSTPTVPSQPTDPSSSSESEPASSETKPAAKTTVKPTAAKSIYVGKTTTVKPNVKNGKGTTTFSTSNKKVATVSSKGVVKGIKKGTVIITVKNNGVKGKVTIKVVQRNNTMTVKTKAIKVKAKTKKITFPKSKVFVVKNARGTVTFKKASGNSKITVSKAGKVTVKKGLMKGNTYTVKVKVTASGSTVYKKLTKSVAFKVKVVK